MKLRLERRTPLVNSNSLCILAFAVAMLVSSCRDSTNKVLRFNIKTESYEDSELKGNATFELTPSTQSLLMDILLKDSVVEIDDGWKVGMCESEELIFYKFINEEIEEIEKRYQQHKRFYVKDGRVLDAHCYDKIVHSPRALNGKETEVLIPSNSTLHSVVSEAQTATEIWALKQGLNSE